MEISKDTVSEPVLQDWYVDFEQSQLIVKINTDEKIKVQVLDKDDQVLHERIYVKKFLSTHVNLVFQDKGVKSEEVLYEYVRQPKQP